LAGDFFYWIQFDKFNLINYNKFMNIDFKENNEEFKIFGMTIEKFSIFYGIFLISFGVVISLISGSNSFTSYIPSFFGLPILIFAFLSIKFVNKPNSDNIFTNVSENCEQKAASEAGIPQHLTPGINNNNYDCSTELSIQKI